MSKLNRKENVENKSKLESVKSVSKKLGISKDKIKKMIQNNEIYFENRNGVYFVNVEEVEKESNETKSNFKTSEYMCINEIMNELDLSKENIFELIKLGSMDIKNINNEIYLDINETLRIKAREIINSEMNGRISFLLSSIEEFTVKIEKDTTFIELFTSIYSDFELESFGDYYINYTIWLLSMENPELREYYNKIHCNNVHLDIEPLSDMIDVYCRIYKYSNNKPLISYEKYTQFSYKKYVNKDNKRIINFIKEHSKRIEKKTSERLLIENDFKDLITLTIGTRNIDILV